MAYYLGYKLPNTDEYQTIKIPNVGTQISDLTDFTFKFETTDDLLDYLYDNDLIPNNYTNIKYLIERGPKGNKYYKPISDCLFASDKEKYFKHSNIKGMFEENKYNKNFIDYIYCFVLDKLGFNNKLKDHLEYVSRDIDAFSKLLIDMSKDNLSVFLKQDLLAAIEFLQSSDVKAINKIDDIIKNLIDRIDCYPSDKIAIFKKLAGNLGIPQTGYLIRINNLKRICTVYNEVGEDVFITDRDFYQDATPEINGFINSLLLEYLGPGKGFRKEGNDVYVKKRELFDLGSALSKYELHLWLLEEYIDSMINPKVDTPVVSNYDDSYDYDNSDDEFLTNEDFEGVEYSPESAGFRIR